jgi:hypothetical protein
MTAADAAFLAAAALCVPVSLATMFLAIRHARRATANYDLAREAMADLMSVVHPVTALALLDGNWEGNAAAAIPQDVWDSLYDGGLIQHGSDETGETWPVLTEKGSAVLLSSLGVVTIEELQAVL